MDNNDQPKLERALYTAPELVELTASESAKSSIATPDAIAGYAPSNTAS